MDNVKYIGMDVHKEAISIAIYFTLSIEGAPF